MGVLKITVQSDRRHRGGTYELHDYSIITQKDQLFLILPTDKKQIKYRIWTDDCEPYIDHIQKFLEQQAKAALQEGKTLEIREDPTRRYIHVGKSLKTRRQFSGERVL